MEGWSANAHFYYDRAMKESETAYNQQYAKNHWSSKLDSWHRDVQKLHESMGIESKSIINEHGGVSKIEITDLAKKVQSFSDVRFSKQENEEKLFWEHHVIEGVKRLDSAKQNVIGYSKQELKAGLVLVSSLLMREVSQSEKSKTKFAQKPKPPIEEYRHKSPRDFETSEVLPQKFFREALHTLLDAQNSSSKTKKEMKKTYHDEFKLASNVFRDVYSKLPDVDKIAFKKSYDKTQKILSHFHDKYKS
jgi:hypothetical protein